MKSADNKPIILVVDDVPGNIKTIKAILSAKYRLLVATNGPDAITTASSKHVDLILLDVVMPEMDGFEVCKRLKADEKTQDIPVIFITAKQDEVDEAMGFELGAVDYITKPISPPIIEARILTQIKILNLNRSLEQSNLFIRKTFGRYMSDELVDNILDTPDGLAFVGERKKVTVMMSDLRGFTAIGERMVPEDAISMLNMYLEAMTEIILKYKGTIIEFLGDGILVIFGTPITREDDSIRAVACALEMQQAMEDVNTNNKKAGYPEAVMGVGIYSGQVIAGNIGSRLRSKYGVVGRAINLASRLESFTVGGEILIAGSTVEECGDILRIDEQWISKIKGVSHPITICQVGGIGHPYNIQLAKPKKEELKPLVHGLQVLITILEGKRADRKPQKGTITKMAPPIAIINTDLKTRRLTNIQIELVDHDGESITDQLYGKVIETDNPPGNLKVQFTSSPPEAEETFRRTIKPH
ncbi:MAG: response regulator [Magnetococcales bacterium]|nr:response regulator [Magnetococcales bacterium]